MAGNLPSLRIWSENRGGRVELLGYNDRNDLGWINWNKRQPHAALRCDYRDRFTERPSRRDVYVMDTFEIQRLRQVDLDDYLLRQNAKRGRVADRGRRYNPALRGDGHRFQHRNINRTDLLAAKQLHRFA